MKTYKTGMLLFPNLTLQDFAGPYDVFVRAGCFEVLLISEETSPIKAEGGLTIQANCSLDDCPPLDIIFVPGGVGINALLTHKKYIAFLQKQAEHAQYITSVCTGSLILGAAGLLDGYKATTHWRSLELLKLFGVETLEQRIVADRNRITGGGVTAGIDFALLLTSILSGDAVAKTIQLMLEYQPAPPFNSGSPLTAEPDIIERAKEKTLAMFEERTKIIETIVSKLTP